MMISEDDQDLVEEDGPSDELHFAVIILAAGSSSRMGTSKQLLEIDGGSLLSNAIHVALTSGAQDVILVLGANEQSHLDLVKGQPVKIVTNHYWKAGMGSSIKTGLQRLIKESPDLDAVIFMACDQPAVRAEHIKALMSTFTTTKKAIVAAAYAQTAGIPALFARSFFSNILMLQDDQGAKKIIGQFPEHVFTVDIPEASIDLDTREDYDSYSQKNKKVISD